MHGIEFSFNDQTVLILLLLVKTVCGICCHLRCMQIPLIVCSPDVKNVSSDVSRTSHGCRVGFLGWRLCFRFTFAIRDTIGRGMM